MSRFQIRFFVVLVATLSYSCAEKSSEQDTADIEEKELLEYVNPLILL